MRLDSGTLVATLAALSFAFAIAGVLGSWRVSRNTGALTKYRETAQAWEGMSRVQEKEIAELQADAKHKDQQIAELTGKVAVLQDALTGRASWEAIERLLTRSLDNQAQIMTALAALPRGAP